MTSHKEARNIKFGHQINIIGRFLWGTLSQVLVLSLAHNYLTNLTEELLLSNLGSKSNSMIEVNRALLHRG